MQIQKQEDNERRAPLPMVLQHRKPGWPLSDFIELLWYCKGHNMPSSKERVLPMGTVELVIHLGNHGPSDSGISGARSRSMVIQRTAIDEMIGVHFKVAGAYPFLRFPSDELHNISICITDLWRDEVADHLLALLNQSRTVEEKFDHLEHFLLRAAARPLETDRAVSFATQEFLRDPGFLSSAAVADTLGMSQRRFIQLFRDWVGMTPKLFCRVQRFHNVIRMTSELQRVDWADVALMHGYYDQAHFIRDFQEFSGATPTEYLDLRTEHMNHLHVRE